MDAAMTNRRTALSAILIAPDPALLAQFSSSTLIEAFGILLELKNYPSEQTLDIRVRQLQPEVILVDVAPNLDASIALIAHLARAHPDIIAVALDRQNVTEHILRVVRAGASEFLYAPFDPANTSEAVSRLLRLRRTDSPGDRELGAVCVFSSVKPGSGASTLATQTAFALKRITSQRVLLADFDLMGGTIGFYLRVNHALSAVDAIEKAPDLSRAAWTSLVSVSSGLDILSAPLVPNAEAIDSDRVQGLIEYARTMYDWIVVDLPVIFQRTSLVTLPHADRTFLVSTSELPSLHLARKSITMLGQLGLPKDRFQVLINRVSRRDGISRADMEKLFTCPVYASFPNDYSSLHRVVTAGEPLSADADLGKAIQSFAGQLASPGKKFASAAHEAK
jgi:pilus assembly protein CpaE